MSSIDSPLPSDALRDVYEQRAELEYPQPAARPDPRVDRKFSRISRLLAERLPVTSFLDAGCGDGRYLPLVADVEPRPSHVVATDISERILATARLAAAQAGLEPELVRANLESLPMADASFDLILCTQVIEHLLDPAAGVRELARVLAPGGSLILSTDNAHCRVTKTLLAPRQAAVKLLHAKGRRHKVHFPEAEFTTDEVRTLVDDAGLQVDELGTFRFTPPPPFGAMGQRFLNWVDERMPRHSVGDILYVVATKP